MKKILLLISLLIPLLGSSQILLTPTGSTRVMIPGVTISNTSATETSLMSNPDTLKANTLLGRPYKFMIMCKATTPAVSVPTLTITLKLGTQSMVVFNAISLVGSQTSQPFVIEGYIFPISATSQLIMITINQTPGSVLTMTSANTTISTNWTANSAITNLFNVTAQWGGFTTLGTASLQSLVFYRYDY